MLKTWMQWYGRRGPLWQSRLRRWVVGPGKRLLSRGVIRQDGFVLAKRLEHAITFKLWLHQTYEPALSALLRKTLQPGDIFLDVGANIGYFTMLGAARVGAAGQVHSFEPNPATFAVLAHNARLNGFAQVRACPLALAEQAGPIQLWFGPGLDDGLASLRRTHTLLTQTIAGQAETLDRYLAAQALDRPVRAMKLDVEGAEALVLTGARQFLAGPHRPALIALEFNRAHLAAFDQPLDASPRLLTQHGYQLFELMEAGDLRPCPPGALLADGTLVALQPG